MKAHRNLKALIPVAIYVASVPANGVPPDTGIRFDEFPRQPADGLSVGPVSFFTGPDVLFNEELETGYPGGGETTLIEHALVGSLDSLILVRFEEPPKYFGFSVAYTDDGDGQGSATYFGAGDLCNPRTFGTGMVGEYFYSSCPDAEITEVVIMFWGSASRFAIDSMSVVWTGGPDGLPIPEASTGIAAGVLALIAGTSVIVRRRGTTVTSQ